jgi:CrcB protein
LYVNLLLIAIGGAAGSVSRYLVSSLVSRLTTPALPAGAFRRRYARLRRLRARRPRGAPLPRSAEARALLVVGVLGGFTTFSRPLRGGRPDA